MTDVPYGHCHCGCGKRTTVLKGEARRYVYGHQHRKSPAYLVDEATGCWVWQLVTNDGGYGLVNAAGKTRSAHRWYYDQYRGSIPEGLELDHLCRNRACVNPDHLEPVTHAVNVQRSVSGKLTPKYVQQIRRSRLSSQELAVRYGVALTTVQAARRFATWRHVGA